MAGLNGIPYAGPTQILLDDCKDRLIDLPPNSMAKLRKVKPGIDGVRAELQQSLPANGATAGLAPTVHQRFVDDSDMIEKLRVHEIELEKALEVVRETRAKVEHERENTVAFVVDVVKSTAQRTGNDALLASFQKTIEYNAQIATKAARTRRKNAAEQVGIEEKTP